MSGEDEEYVFDEATGEWRPASEVAAAAEAVVEVRELGLPGAQVAPVPATFPDRCTSGLLSVDGRDLPVRLTGSPLSAIAGRPVAVEPCAEAADLALTANFR